jgi:hypothetical protein
MLSGVCMKSKSKQEKKVPSVVIGVEPYPVAHPKFTKQTWESGENGGEGAEAG